ncbi:MAG TPA: hypothetical protein VGE20_16545 [Ramlibacter sp.]
MALSPRTAVICSRGRRTVLAGRPRPGPDAFFGLYGPANMAAARTQKISDAVAKALANPEVQAKIRALALTSSYAGPQALATTQATHLKRWEAPVKASGYSLDQ